MTKRLLDLLLGTDPVQRTRLTQAAMALLLLSAGVLGMLYFALAGVVPAAPVCWWSGITLLCMLGFFVLIRSGVSRRWGEPSLTVPQMLFGITAGAVAYTLLGAGRGAVFPMLMAVLTFGMFIAPQRQMRWVSAYAVSLFGATMAAMALRQPQSYPPAIEGGHFVLVATMVPAVSLLAARLAGLRQRARHQRAELAQALARLREHTTRDELTGLVNRRHMQALLEQEHQRCVRSGQSFCIAMLDIDHFKPINQTHGYAVGDAVLRAVADEARRQVRSADLLSRWGGEEFLLLMTDTRAALARGGLERLQDKLAALRILHGSHALGVTLSSGLAEHHAGESVAQTLERAERALHEARAAGRNRMAVAA